MHLKVLSVCSIRHVILHFKLLGGPLKKKTTWIKNVPHFPPPPYRGKRRCKLCCCFSSIFLYSTLIFRGGPSQFWYKPPEGGSALVQILHWSFAEAASSWIQSWQIQQQQAGDASKQGELGHSAAPKWLPCRLSQLFITASASSELLWKGNKFYHRFCEQERREKVTSVTSDIHGKIWKALDHLKSLFWTNFNRVLLFAINLHNSVGIK